MIVVVQQVKNAEVLINNKIYSSINKGMLIFIGIHAKDTFDDIKYLVKKIMQLRIFKDASNKMNLSILDLDLSILLISQFTLCANTKRGNRPSFIDAADPDKARKLYDLFIKEIIKYKINIETGEFGANMKINLVNDGPNTFILES